METKDCEKVLDLLNQYIDGELNADDAELVRAHIETCGSCKKAYGELLELGKIFEEATEDAPAELCGAVMAKVRAQKSVAKRTRFTRRWGGIAIAAAISLTVLASPAILLVANGGAKASDMAEALSPTVNNAEADRYYSDASGMVPECEEVNTKLDGVYDDILDVAESVKVDLEDEISDTTTGQGKKYTAYLADGSKATVIFTQDTAILDGKEYQYTLSDGKYLITMGERVANFERIDGEEIYFKETGETND